MVLGIITAVLPILLKLLGLILDKVGANAEARELVKELIRMSKNDGLISVRNADSQESHRNDVLKQIEDAKNGK